MAEHGNVPADSEGDKATLTHDEVASVQKAHLAAAAQLLGHEPPLQNVNGYGIGVKWTAGQPTGEPALHVFVTQKVERGQMNPADLVPSRIEGMQTDVLAIGYPMAQSLHPLSRRIRPALGGYSVGHINITAGTIGSMVYDILPGGGFFPFPMQGIGQPKKYYILSNNHVLANSNAASLGDPILQPGPFDGGTFPADLIANLSHFIPITFFPPVPLTLHNNIVDAAIAEAVESSDLNREIHWIGRVDGWRQFIQPGQMVRKTGRTSNYTTGRCVSVNAVIDVTYPGVGVARFRDQLLFTKMSDGGDSGSLIFLEDLQPPVRNLAVGLLFAGSSSVTIANRIDNVRQLLAVEVGEALG